jgi:Uma2 family endonuclease
MQKEFSMVQLELRYHKAAQDYLRKLPLEHFMEATTQARQREITLESLALVRARRSDVQVFNELLVQYPVQGKKRPGQVVPDNMVVIHDQPIKADGSYDVPLQPVGPFWVLEYVSRSTSRKDYDDNMRKYEHELRVPYYLLFAPDEQEVTLYRLTGERRYVSVPPDADGRLELPELDLAMGLLDRWVRFWHQGKLLPLPEDLQRSLDETRRQLADALLRADAAERESARLRAELEALRARRANGG